MSCHTPIVVALDYEKQADALNLVSQLGTGKKKKRPNHFTQRQIKSHPTNTNPFLKKCGYSHRHQIFPTRLAFGSACREDEVSFLRLWCPKNRGGAETRPGRGTASPGGGTPPKKTRKIRGAGDGAR
ncbi:hypothetical protein ALON55S_03607 [Alishewanella longhuensis]